MQEYEIKGTGRVFSEALISRLCYRRGYPFAISAVLALVTAAWPRVREAIFHQGTSIWTMAILATIAAVLSLLCGGRFRTFFISIMVTPPFLFALPWFIRSTIRHPEFPIKGFVEYFLCFVAAPIIFVWLFATIFNRKEPSV
jgi:hypothetical protein